MRPKNENWKVIEHTIRNSVRIWLNLIIIIGSFWKLKILVRMYYGFGTGGRCCMCDLQTRLADAACALTRWQHFSAWNYILAAILNVWRHIWNPTPSVDAHLLQEQSPCQISLRSDLKRRSLKPCPHCRRKVRLSRWIKINILVLLAITDVCVW